MKTKFFYSLVSFSLITGVQGQNWQSMLEGIQANGDIRAFAFDSSQNILYVGGAFSRINNTDANNIAMWNGTSWLSLADGLNNAVEALCIFNGDLYAGGSFTSTGTGITANYCFGGKWNGSAWSPLGNCGSSALIMDLIVYHNELYAATNLNYVSVNKATNIFKYDGTDWNPIGISMPTGIGQAFAIYNDSLITGSTSGIFKLADTTWLPFAGGTNQKVLSLLVDNGNLYAGGEFNNIGGTVMQKAGKWNGSSWSALGNGMPGINDAVYGLAAYQGNIYAGGKFTTAGGVTVNNVAEWNGSSWAAMGAGVDNQVRALASQNNQLYTGGLFVYADNKVCVGLGQWNGISWNTDSVKNKFNGNINASVYDTVNNILYVGGSFAFAGNAACINIAQWDGSKWSSLGEGINYSVAGLGIYKGDLYASGNFTRAGTVTVTSNAKWNGTSWSAWGSGFNKVITAFAEYNNDLYAGGSFTYGTIKNIGQWNGTGWNQVSGGTDAGVSALKIFNNNLYVAGSFTIAGTTPASRIAKWDGVSWSALGTGANNTIVSLTVHQGKLAAGGNFTTAGGSAANYAATWDGANWAVLGAGTNNAIKTLSSFKSYLFAGGGSIAPGYIVKWDGNSWKGVNGGMNYWVNTSCASPNQLFVGGQFGTAGGYTVNAMTRINCAAPAVISPAGTPQFCQGSSVTLSLNGFDSYQWSTGATTSAITVNAAGQYSVSATGICGVMASNSSVVTVLPSPPQPTVTLNGTTLASSSAYSYQWYVNGTAIAGATGQNHVAAQNGSYHVVASDTNGCTSASAPVNVAVTDVVSQIATTGFRIYPNPFSSHAVIQAEQPMQNALLTLYNSTGQRVLEIKNIRGQSITLSRNGLPGGLYLTGLQEEGKAASVSRILISDVQR